MIGPPVLLGAPSAIGLRPYDNGGVRRLDRTPPALRAQNLSERIGAQDLGDVVPPARYEDLVKPHGRGRNERDVAAYSAALAQRIAPASADGRFVVLLGGDCSIMLGSLLGVREARGGPVGVVYVDGHADFASLDESPSGSACSMNLALATGRSKTPLARLAGEEPLVDPRNVVHIGARDAGAPYGYDALADWGILNLDGETVQRQGAAAVADAALTHVAQLEHGFWIHVDVDVLDPRLMPAVDTPEPGGLTFEALEDLLRPLVRDSHALGLQLTIYDASLDRGAAAPALVDLLAAVCAD